MAEFAGRQIGDLSIEDVLSHLNRITEGKKLQMIKVIFRYTHLMTTQRHLGKVTDTEAIWWMTASTRIAAEGEVRKAPPGFLCYLKDMQVLKAGVAFGTRAGSCKQGKPGMTQTYLRFPGSRISWACWEISQALRSAIRRRKWVDFFGFDFSAFYR